MRISRREFAYLSTASLRAAVTRPDLILYNGTLHTMDPANPRAEAAAIAGDRFFAVGTNDEIRNLATASTRKIDLGGRAVVPGFIDAHLHVAYSGIRHLKQVNCDLRSIAAIQAAIRERAAITTPGAWIVGFLYDDTKPAEHRALTIADLDAAAPDHPVIITHRGGHTSWVNSHALKTAGVGDSTPDPPGGKYGRGPAGKLTGRLMETPAARPFLAKIEDSSTRADRREGVKSFARLIVRSGITSAHDPLGSTEDLTAYQDALEQGELSVRIYCFIHQQEIQRMLDAGVRSGLGNEWVRVGAMKMVSDGSISERTARISQSYIGRPDDHGILVLTEEQRYEYARAARRRMAHRHPRQRRCRHRYRAARLRKARARNAAPRSALSHRALHHH